MLLRGTGLSGMYVPAGIDADVDEMGSDCLNCGDWIGAQQTVRDGLCPRCYSYRRNNGQDRPPVVGDMRLVDYPDIRTAPDDCECGAEPAAAVQWRIGKGPRLLWLCGDCLAWWRETEKELDYKTTLIEEVKR